MRCAIVGNGVAGVTAALGVRERDPRASISLISGESDYFFSRTALMYAFMDRLTRRDLEPYERGVFEAQRIERVRGWVKDLDADSSTVTLDNGRTLGWDRLLIATGSKPRRPQWQGLESVRSGQVHFVSMQDLEACEASVRRGEKAVVVGGGLIGIELAECLNWAGMEVSFLIREPWYWPVALSDPESAMAIAHMRHHGVNVVTGETVAAVETDARGAVTGVVTERNRRYECRLLGVCIGVEPAVEWLKSVATPPRMNRGIVVDAGFRTSLAGVFPLATARRSNWAAAQRWSSNYGTRPSGRGVSRRAPYWASRSSTSRRFSSIARSFSTSSIRRSDASLGRCGSSTAGWKGATPACG